MDEIIYVGIESGTTSLKQDMSVEDAIKLIVEHAPTLDEAMRASEILETVWSSGSFEGTGWRFWFSRKDPVKVLH